MASKKTDSDFTLPSSGIIPCLSSTFLTYYGYEYDCDYPKAGEIPDCSYCLCVKGGQYNPIDGKKWRKFRLFIYQLFRLKIKKAWDV